MNKKNIEAFSLIPQPSESGFIQDLVRPMTYHFQKKGGCQAGENFGCLSSGVEILIDFPEIPEFPETAFVSLRRVLVSKEVYEKKGTYPLYFILNSSLEKEEYQLIISSSKTILAAGDADGLRRGVYFLEDRICEAKSNSITAGKWCRKPFVKHRISRCFFGPTNRPPFYIDELTNDVDYYPEEYLNKLAHEGINGLWLTMYFRDLPSSFFPKRGENAEKRFKKLQLTVERCARYGIKIYVFLSEPKRFGAGPFAVPAKDAAEHPELIGIRQGKGGYFCTSQETGKKYLTECVSRIFKNVPKLGGIINIMLGEDNGSCIAHLVNFGHRKGESCPFCARRDEADVFAEQAVLFTEAIRKYAPEAEYIGWFYCPGLRDGSDKTKKILRIAEKWPTESTLMLNFESGGHIRQLGKDRIVFDYSLAFIGPSRLYADACTKAPRMGAKIQVGCSHEDASVPFIPVPENLYKKYKFLHEHNVSTVMQCWYFGNYPGLMNKAAGELSFTPFPRSMKKFLIELARPEWRNDAEKVALAWHYFSQAYRNFPGNIAFEWFGPLHHSIVWPLYLFPEDKPLVQSWLLEDFPRVCGDRIGECIAYNHTLSEALELCGRMSNIWQKGLRIFDSIRDRYRNDNARMADICLAESIGLQMKSTCNVLRFYWLREDMFFTHQNHLVKMKRIILNEIANSAAMKNLCKIDNRLGYHSEAEGYLFFPEKLQARMKLLKELLTVDFQKFDLNAAWIDEYTGAKRIGPSAFCRRIGMSEDHYEMGNGTSWSISRDDKRLFLKLKGVEGKKYSVIIEPCRMWIPFRIDFAESGEYIFHSTPFPILPQLKISAKKNEQTISIPLQIFDGFRREGFPMRINIYGDGFAWVKNTPWPYRLLQEDSNPACLGWLVFDELPFEHQQGTFL